MAGRKIKLLSSLDGHDFKKYMHVEHSAEVKIRLLGLAHVQENKSCRKTAKIMRFHENTIQSWVRRFAEGGLKALQNQPKQGKPKRINTLDLPEIKRGILALQEKRSGGRIRGKDVQKYLFEKWNIVYQKTAVYDLLKSLNLVWISARSKHPSSNASIQNAFKKTLLMKSNDVFPQKQI